MHIHQGGGQGKGGRWRISSSEPFPHQPATQPPGEPSGEQSGVPLGHPSPQPSKLPTGHLLTDSLDSLSLSHTRTAEAEPGFTGEVTPLQAQLFLRMLITTGLDAVLYSKEEAHSPRKATQGGAELKIGSKSKSLSRRLAPRVRLRTPSSPSLRALG